jgi:hypothetical protein
MFIVSNVVNGLTICIDLLRTVVTALTIHLHLSLQYGGNSAYRIH